MLIADAHLDLAMNALNYNRNLELPVSEIRAAEGGGTGTVSFPAMRKGKVALCAATLFARTARPERGQSGGASREISHAQAQGQLAYYRVLEAQGKMRIMRSADDLQTHLADWEARGAEAPVGAVVAMEGADPIVSPEQAAEWYEGGLRALSLAHYGVSAYAHGTGADGGLTELGKPLLREMERLGIVLDVTHLSDRSFWEALDAYGGHVHASHSNCRALAPGVRQIDDDQIRALAERGGVVGAALDSEMLMPDWKPKMRASIDDVVHHIDRVCQIAGSSEHAGIGSDLDGGFGRERIPRGIDTIADLPKIVHRLQERGYSEQDAENVAYGNWLRFFTNAWS